MKENHIMKKKILVTLNEKQYEILKELDELGSRDSEKLKNPESRIEIELRIKPAGHQQEAMPLV